MIDIREHRLGHDLKSFIRVPYEIFRGDPNFVPPLEMEIRDRLTPGKNPFFEHAQGTLFTAWKNGRAVGRCSAQVDHDHLRIHKDDVGFFGFFDTIDDVEVARGLLDSAQAWLAQRGMKTMRGPISLNMNEEVGTLIEGFDTPPMIMMPHSPRYQAEVMEAAGLKKARDLFAWSYEAGDLPKRVTRAWEEITSMPEVSIRSVNVSDMENELKILLEIFNDAWQDNWGFVPTTEAETKKVAKDMRMILDPELAFIVEIHGRPMAICVIIPNLNEAIRDFKGKLTPMTLMKLVWRMKVRHPSAARLMMLGIRKELRHQKRYGGLSSALYVEAHRRGTKRGYYKGELSWTLEDNLPINLGIRSMGAKVYKKYRVFEKAI